MILHATRRGATKSALSFILFVVLVYNCFTVAAGAIVSERRAYGPVDGHSYFNWNELRNEGTNGSWGFMVAETQQGSNVPPGWIGTDALVYTESYALCEESGWSYNSVTLSGWDAGVTGIAARCGTQLYFAQGYSRAWDGTSYNTYSSNGTDWLRI